MAGKPKPATLATLLRSSRGQGLVEYALILILVAVVIIIVLVSLGGQTTNMFSNIAVAIGA